MEISGNTKYDILPEMSQRLRVFGFTSALLIVLIHSTPNPPLDNWQWWVVKLFMRDGVCRIAVPYFFLSAGFFLAGHINETGWWMCENRKRVRTLLVTYVLWIFIGLAFNFSLWLCIRIVGKTCGFVNPFYEPLYLWIVNTFGLNPFANTIGVLWFLRDLFLLVVLSPIIVFALKWIGWWLVFFLFFVYGIVSIVLVDLDKNWFNFFEYFFSMRGLCYFTSGILLRHVCVKNWFYRSFAKYTAIFVGGGMVVAKVSLIRFGLMKAAALLDVGMVPVLGVGLFLALGRMKLPVLLMDNTFALYLIHAKVLLLSIVVITGIGIKDMLGTSILVSIFRFIFAVSVSIGISALVKRYLPNSSKLFFGNR